MAPHGPNSAAFLWGRDKWYQSRIAPYGGKRRRVGIIPGGNGCPSGILLRGDIFFASAEPRYYWIGNQYSCSGTVCAEVRVLTGHM